MSYDLKRLTSPTVKVRRLGYIVSLTQILSRTPVPNLALPRMLSRRSRDDHGLLSSYCLNLPVIRRTKQRITGEIKSKDAALRYISTAQQMGFIVRVVQEWRSTKIGKVLSVLPATSNPFELSLGQIFLVLRQLLMTDLGCLRAIVGIAGRRKSTRDEAASFRRIMKGKYVSRWKKPTEYYSENIKAPRLEWLTDLKLVRSWNTAANHVIYRQGVDAILSHKWSPEQIEIKYPDRFYHCYGDFFKKPVVEWRTLEEDERRERLSTLLKNSIELFKPSAALDKISADQFFTFSTCTLLTERNIVSSRQDLEADLIQLTVGGRLPYRYVRMISHVDTGYIIRVNS